MASIVTYLTQVPPADADEKIRIKYPDVCRELLCSDTWQLIDAVSAQGNHLPSLFAFLAEAPSEDPEKSTIANNCARVLLAISQRKSSEIAKYLGENEGLVDGLVAHVSNPNVSDLILRLVDADIIGVIHKSELSYPASTVCFLFFMSYCLET